MPKKLDSRNQIDIDRIYTIIDLYFKQKNIMYTHLYNSFDKFLDEDVHNFLKNNSNIFFEKITKDKVYKYKFKFDEISIKPPYMDLDDEIMFPSNARTRYLTYASKLVANISQIQEITDIATGNISTNLVGTIEKEYPIAIIPIMVRSKYCTINLIKKGYDKDECEYDPGGYFIINGSEKVVMSLERMIDNRPLVFIKKDASSTIYTVQVNSKSHKSDTMQIINIRLKKDSNMVIKIPILAEVPVFILIRALGVESDADIINYILQDQDDNDLINLIRISLENSRSDTDIKIVNQDDALNYLTTKMKIIKKYNETDKNIKSQEKKLHLIQLLNENFLPHMESNLIHKAYFLATMINRLLQTVLGRIKPDDRDSYINKRVDLPGQLMFDLFKQYYRKMLNECNKFFKKRNSGDESPLNIINQIKPNIIEQGLKTALLTGAWGKKKGVAQILQRLTFLQTLSSLRRINSPTMDASTNKLTGPRHLHGTTVGPLCLTGDMEILLEGDKLKKLSNITSKDRVITINPTKLYPELSSIKNIFSKIPDKLLKIQLNNNIFLKATPDHKILIQISENNYTMVPVKKLKPGDIAIIYIINKIEFIKILNISNIPPESVFDFTTESPNHNFIANNFIVSNCFQETPEGAKIGLVKNLSLIGNISIMKNSQIDIIKGFVKPKIKNIEDIPAPQLKSYTRVLLNGEIIGLTNTPRELYLELKQAKYNGTFDPYTGIAHDIRSEIECHDLRINCDTGRIFHPVLRVQNNELLLSPDMVDLITMDEKFSTTKITSWNQFMIKFPGVLEYLDPDEKYNSMIAILPTYVESERLKMANSIKLISQLAPDEISHVINRYDDLTYIKYTHCEIHPSLLIGIVVSNIPFCQCNQGPRNVFQYSQARQAIGIYATNYRSRLDISYILYHPQRPIVTTRNMRYIGTENLPAGENCIVAIACYSGYNQEDSNIMNLAAIDRGLFRSTSLKKYKTTIQKNQSTSQDDIFLKPDRSQVSGMRQGSYDKLNEKGFAPEETIVENNDIIIGKVSPIQPVGNSDKVFKDSSEYYKSHVPGVIDKVWTDIYNNEGYEMRKVRVRSERVPMIGDKYSCYDPSHDVLTDQGWINITNLTKSYKIACLNNNKLEYNYPSEIQIYDYSGQIYLIQNNQASLRVTPNHRMLVSDQTGQFKIYLAAEIYNKNYKYKKTVSEYNPEYIPPEFLTKNNKIYKFKNNSWEFDINLFLVLFGTWISSGNYNKYLYFPKNNFVKNLLDKLKIKYQVNKNKIKINNPEIINIFKNKFPNWIWYLPLDLARKLLFSILNNKINPKYFDNIQRLCLHAGYYFDKSKTNNNLEKFEYYSGKIYCCSVPGDGIIYVRRHGIPVWCGQSRNAQKGTCGITLSTTDMPFTSNGLTPDIIINPNALPSRMTLAQFLEALLGKAAALSGQEMDGTPFLDFDIQDIKQLLKSYGYEENGYETLYNGMTGQKLKTQIFIGPTYYQRLKHLVNDKIHSRARGPQTILTRQPPEGRSRDGGLRLGEMERDSLIAHAMARFLKERLLETADVYQCYVCGVCGLFAQRMLRKDNKPYTTKTDIYFCPGCKNTTDISKIRIPYAFKLLIQELMAMSIVSRIRVKKLAYEN